MTDEHPTPDAIMQLGLAFWGSKALLSAIELDLFTMLAQGPLTGETLIANLGCRHGAPPTGSTRWSRSACSNGSSTNTPTPQPPTCSSTATSRLTSAGSWRWPT